MRYLSKLAIAASMMFGVAGITNADELSDFPSYTPNVKSCIQGVMLVEAYQNTLENLPLEGWKTVATNSRYIDDLFWQAMELSTWRAITASSTFEKIGVSKPLLNTVFTQIHRQANFSEGKESIETIIQDMYTKCYSHFKAKPFSEEEIFDLSEEIHNGQGGQDFGWEQYKFLVKMDYNGNKL